MSPELAILISSINHCLVRYHILRWPKYFTKKCVTDESHSVGISLKLFGILMVLLVNCLSFIIKFPFLRSAWSWNQLLVLTIKQVPNPSTSCWNRLNLKNLWLLYATFLNLIKLKLVYAYFSIICWPITTALNFYQCKLLKQSKFFKRLQQWLVITDFGGVTQKYELRVSFKNAYV